MCEGVRGPVKYLATRASLLRPLDNQILTPYQLFEFASQDISGITSFYVDLETVKKSAAILEPQFVKAEQIKGTRNHHQFVSEGNTKSMIRISGSTSNVDTILLMPTEWILTISHLVHIMLANMTTICLYFCIVNYVSMEHSDVNVKFIHPKAPAKKFFWPDCEDVSWIPLNHMICRVEPPSSGSTA